LIGQMFTVYDLKLYRRTDLIAHYVWY